MSKHFDSKEEIRIHNVQIAMREFLVDVLKHSNEEVNEEIMSWNLSELKKQREFFISKFKDEFISFYNKKYNGMLPIAEDILFKKITRK